MSDVEKARQNRLDGVISYLNKHYSSIVDYYNKYILSGAELTTEDIDDELLKSFEIFCRFYPYTGQDIVLLTANPRLDTNLLKYENCEISDVGQSAKKMAEVSQRYYMGYLSRDNRNHVRAIVNSVGTFFDYSGSSRVAAAFDWHPAEATVPDGKQTPNIWNRYFYPELPQSDKSRVEKEYHQRDWPEPIPPSGDPRASEAPWLDVYSNGQDFHFFDDFYVASAYLPATEKAKQIKTKDIPDYLISDLKEELSAVDPSIIIPLGNESKEILSRAFDVSPVKDGHSKLCSEASPPPSDFFDEGISKIQGRLYKTDDGINIIPMVHFNGSNSNIERQEFQKAIGSECPGLGAYAEVKKPNGYATFYENCKLLSEDFA